MDKTYDPHKYEQKIYENWEKSGAFKPNNDPKSTPFSILMPPPNANADLHLGHTLTTTIEDILARYARMQGKSTLFLPGADHAGFETQVVYERELEKQGKSRFDFDRQELYQQIWDYVQDNKGKMEAQQRRIGASVDWSRNTFTLDPHIIKRTYQTFQMLWDDGLIYRGPRIVNYCTRHGTSFSELEVEYKPTKAKIWYIRYPIENTAKFITVATTRPETLLGDTAVAVHPDDHRYIGLIGKFVKLPLTNRLIPIVADSAVDPKFGTGAVKVTPGHDQTDFEIGERHKLPVLSVIGTDGKMTTAAPLPYQGLDVQSARQEVVNDLKVAKLLQETRDISNSVGHCYKCGTVIEPLVIDQWLIKMKPLADEAIKHLKDGEIEFVPKRMQRVMFQWLENIKDWNISRQIAWGIPIPAFISDDGEVLVDITEKKNLITKDGKKFQRDQDTFDTWFSSGQWPIATLNFPDNADFKKFYPTNVMETAGEIIFFWVARMIMLGLYVTKEVPFRTVYLHGLVLDPKGKKMSKSKGNVVSPMTLIEQYGADALRMGIIAGRSAGLNQGFDESRVVAYRNLCNKLWNIARYVQSQSPAPTTLDLDLDSPETIAKLDLASKWILHDLSVKSKQISRHLEAYRFSQALEALYDFIWHDLADWYLESQKSNTAYDQATGVLRDVLKSCLILLHPFAPFVTECIWGEIGESKPLISTSWTNSNYSFPKAARQFQSLRSLINNIRSHKIALGASRPNLYSTDKLVQDNTDLINQLAGVQVQKGSGVGLALSSSGMHVVLDATPEQILHLRQKATANLTNLQALSETIKQLLANKKFLASASPEVIKSKQESLNSTEAKIRTLIEQLGHAKS